MNGWSLNQRCVGSRCGGFGPTRFGRVRDRFDALHRYLFDLGEAFGLMPASEVLGMAAVAVETLVVAAGGMVGCTPQVRVDGLIDQRCVDVLERSERVSQAVQIHSTPLGKTNCLWRH